jgi:hypothetical protein
MCQVKLCRGQNINTSRGFSALAGTNGAFGNTGRASDSQAIHDSDYSFRILVRPAGRSEVGDYGPITNSVYLFKS